MLYNVLFKKKKSKPKIMLACRPSRDCIKAGILYFLPLVLELILEFLALAWRFGSLVVLPAQVPLVKVSSPALNVKYPPICVSWPNSEVYST
jgi:hypothetical protein